MPAIFSWRKPSIRREKLLWRLPQKTRHRRRCTRTTAKTLTIRGQTSMNKDQFLHIRKQLRKTQKQLAALLGVSLNAMRSYEQGWRSIPAHVERQVLFLASRTSGSRELSPCWAIKNCPPERKTRCPAWEFQCGGLCWFITGTMCEGAIQKNWKEKMKLCRACDVFQQISPTLL